MVRGLGEKEAGVSLLKLPPGHTEVTTGQQQEEEEGGQVGGGG